MPRSSAAFRNYALGVLAFNLGVILWGAYVRATGAGAGCGEHWPVCNGDVIPRAPSVQTLIEYTHRVTSGLALLLVVALYVWARNAHPPKHSVRSAALAALVLILAEAALGAGLVLLRLVALDASVQRAIAMSAHLTNTFLLLAALGTTVWHAHAGPARPRAPGGALVWATLAAFVFVGVSGAIAALGDTLLQLGVSNAFVELLIALRVAHPALALGECLLLAALASALWAKRPDARGAVTVFLSLVAAQLCIGALNVALQAPVFMQLLHLLAADCVWLSLVVTARIALYEPAQPEAVDAEPAVA